MMAAKSGEHPAGLRGQLELFRDYALPNFRDLLFEVAKGPAMLVWLDGRSNTKTRPQENFARELMELFTIGVGQFTEADVRAAARVFTGWTLQRIGDGDDPCASTSSSSTPASMMLGKTFSFPIYVDGIEPSRRARHRRMEDGLDFLAALARHPETARRLARKLWSFFVSEIHPPDEGFVAHSNVYLSSDTHMAPVVRAVLRSSQFDASSSYFARYSWPVEYVARALKEVGYAWYPLNARWARWPTWGSSSSSRLMWPDGIAARRGFPRRPCWPG